MPARRATYRARRCGATPLVRLDRLDHLRVDAQHRVERHHRVLEDHRDALAPQRPQAVGPAPTRSSPLEQDAATDDPARRVDQAEDREAGDRLAGAGFADQPQHLAAANVEAHAVDRLDHARPVEEMRPEVLDLEGGLRIALTFAQPRVQHVAQAVADDVDAEDQRQQQHARKDADPVVAREQELVAVGDQQAERRLGDRQADAEEARASPRRRWRSRPGSCR